MSYLMYKCQIQSNSLPMTSAPPTAPPKWTSPLLRKRLQQVNLLEVDNRYR